MATKQMSRQKEQRVVAVYMDALGKVAQHRRMKKIDPTVAERRLATLRERIDSADTQIKKLGLIQQRINLERRLKKQSTPVDITKQEDAFVNVVATYSGRRGISYEAWREVGVPSAVLKRAGLSPTHWKLR